MTLELTDAVGYVAACLTTVSFVPQAIKVYRTGDTSSISLWMFLLFNVGVFTWLYYGILINELPIILANVITMFFSLYILFVKIRNLIRKK